MRLIDAKVLVELIKNYAKEVIDANQKTLDPVDQVKAINTKLSALLALTVRPEIFTLNTLHTTCTLLSIC